jgi:hypothetical protein
MPKRTCAVEDCDRDAKGGDLCTMHYQRRHKGDPDWAAPGPRIRPRSGQCGVDGCERPVWSAGRCSTHYQRPQENRACEVSGCERPYYSVGMCRLHYVRKRRADPDWDDLGPHAPGSKPSRDPDALCAVDGCGRKVMAVDLCQRHYLRRTAGDPKWDRPIEMRQRRSRG